MSGVTAVGAIRTTSPVGAVTVSPVRTIRYTSSAYMVATSWPAPLYSAIAPYQPPSVAGTRCARDSETASARSTAAAPAMFSDTLLRTDETGAPSSPAAWPSESIWLLRARSMHP